MNALLPINEIAQHYFSLNQAASYLGLSPKTMYAWAEGKKIPAYKVGRLWRFDRSELDRFVRSETATHPGGPRHTAGEASPDVWRAPEVWRKQNSFL